MKRSLLTTLTVLLVTSVASATVMRLWPLDELTRRSDLVVVAKAEPGTSFWRDGRIFTRVPLQVEETWRGSAASRITVLTLGGIVGKLGQQVSGEAALPAGQRLVVFLRADASGELYPSGMWQGVFAIAEGPIDDPAVTRAQSDAWFINELRSVPPATLSQLHQVVSAAGAR